jgi:hypothetical protein
MFRKSCYKQKALNENDTIHFRVINDEYVEIIIDFLTHSYVAIGWRSLSEQGECRSNPDVGVERGGFSESIFYTVFLLFRKQLNLNLSNLNI